jgi:hypothetical protein
MNKYKKIGLLSLVLPSICLVNSAEAQNIMDGGQYSGTSSFATARSIGFGNALGSVGGDFASLSVNPAGIGVYRTSEFMVTPGLRFNGSKSNYSDGGSMSDNGTRFGFNNMGMVFTDSREGKEYKRSNWKSISFGIGINRTADFNRNYNYTGSNHTSSGSQYFENDAQNYPEHTQLNNGYDGTPGYLGYQSYLLADNTYNSLVPYQKGIAQTKDIQEKGGITELDFTLGGNYKEKLLIGATLGIPILRHVVSSTYSEQTINPSPSDSFKRFDYSENYKTTGAGVNLKLGAIYKFNDYFRMGLAFHTPSILSLNEVSDASITTNSNNFAGINTIDAPRNEYNYQVVTPFKTVLSATGILGKHGFVSLDYEFVNYASMRYYMDDKNYQTQLNNQIKQLYTTASNIRAGVELKFDQFMVRGGVGFYGSPYKNQDYQSNRLDLSIGVGYRFDNMFIDLGVINSTYSTSEQPYILAQGYTQAPYAKIDNSRTIGLITFGVKM